MPIQGFGKVGDYAIIVTKDNNNSLWYKNMDNIWVNPNNTDMESSFTSGNSNPTFTSQKWQTSWPLISTTLASPQSGDRIVINNTEITFGTVTLNAICTAINVAMTNKGVGAKNVGVLS